MRSKAKAPKAKAVTKATKKAVKKTVVFDLAEDPETGLGVIGADDPELGPDYGCAAWQRAWNRKDLALPAFSTSPVVVVKPGNGLSLKFGAKGVVTVAGKLGGVKVSATTYTLARAWQSTMTPNLLTEVCVYIAPSKKGLAEAFCEVYDVVLSVGAKGVFDTAFIPE